MSKSFSLRSLRLHGDTALTVAWYGGWFGVFWLACRQAIWLFGGSNDPLQSIGEGVALTFGKWALDSQSLKNENELRATLRALVLFGAKPRSVDRENPTPIEGDNLPLWIALGSSVDLRSYLSGRAPENFRGLIHSVGAYARDAELQRRLETLDCAILRAVKGVEGTSTPSVIFGLRKTLLEDAAARYRQGATHPTALVGRIRDLEAELPSRSAIGIFLDRLGIELGATKQSGDYDLTWEAFESWLKATPPSSIGDLLGENGRGVRMEMPETLRRALEQDREVEQYKGGKTYDH